MDFHSLPRRQLQTLCKKHGIPANSTNAEMATSLSDLFKIQPQIKEKCIQAHDPHISASECISEIRISERNTEKVGKSERVTRASMKDKSTQKRGSEITDVSTNHISQKDVFTSCNFRSSSSRKGAGQLRTDSSNTHLVDNTSVGSKASTTKSIPLIDSSVTLNPLSDSNGNSSSLADSTRSMAARSREGQIVPRRTRANTRTSDSHLESAISNAEVKGAVETSKDEVMHMEGQGTNQKIALKTCLKVDSNKGAIREKKRVVTFSDTVDIKEIDCSEKECSPLPVKKNTLRNFRKEVTSVENKQVMKISNMSACQTSHKVSSVEKGVITRKRVRKNHGGIGKDISMVSDSFLQQPVKSNSSRNLRNRANKIKEEFCTTLNGNNKEEGRQEKRVDGLSVLSGLNKDVSEESGQQLQDTAEDKFQSSPVSLNESCSNAFLLENNMGLNYSDEHHDFFVATRETHISEISEQSDQGNIPYTGIAIEFNRDDRSLHKSNVECHEIEESDDCCASNRNYQDSEHQQQNTVADRLTSSLESSNESCSNGGFLFESNTGLNYYDENRDYVLGIRETHISEISDQSDQGGSPYSKIAVELNCEEELADFCATENQDSYISRIHEHSDHNRNSLTKADEFPENKQEFQDQIFVLGIVDDIANEEVSSHESGMSPNSSKKHYVSGCHEIMGEDHASKISQQSDHLGYFSPKDVEFSTINEKFQDFLPYPEVVEDMIREEVTAPLADNQTCERQRESKKICERQREDKLKKADVKYDLLSHTGSTMRCINISIKLNNFEMESLNSAEESLENKSRSPLIDEEVPQPDNKGSDEDDSLCDSDSPYSKEGSQYYNLNLEISEEMASNETFMEKKEDQLKKGDTGYIGLFYTSEVDECDTNSDYSKNNDDLSHKLLESAQESPQNECSGTVTDDGVGLPAENTVVHKHDSICFTNFLRYEKENQEGFNCPGFAQELAVMQLTAPLADNKTCLGKGEDKVKDAGIEYDTLCAGKISLQDTNLNTLKKNDDFAEKLSEEERSKKERIVDEEVGYKHETMSSSNLARNEEEIHNLSRCPQTAEDVAINGLTLSLADKEASSESAEHQVKKYEMDYAMLHASEDHVADTGLTEGNLNASIAEKWSQGAAEPPEKDIKSALTDEEATFHVNKDEYKHNSFSINGKQGIQDGLPHPKIGEDMATKEGSFPLADNEPCGRKGYDKIKVNDMECDSVQGSELNPLDIRFPEDSLSFTMHIDNSAEKSFDSAEESLEKESKAFKCEEARCSEHKEGRNQTQEINGDEKDKIMECMKNSDAREIVLSEFSKNRDPNMNSELIYVSDGQACGCPDMLKAHDEIMDPCDGIPFPGSNHTTCTGEIELRNLGHNINAEEKDESQSFTMIFHGCCQEEQSLVEAEKVYTEVKREPKLDPQKMLCRNLQISQANSESKLSFTGMENLEPIRHLQLLSDGCGIERAHALHPKILTNYTGDNTSLDLEGTKIDAQGISIIADDECVARNSETDNQVEEQMVGFVNSVVESDDAMSSPDQLDNCNITCDTSVQREKTEIKREEAKEKVEAVDREHRIRLRLSIQAGQNLNGASLHEELSRMKRENVEDAVEARSSQQSATQVTQDLLEISKEESMKQIDLTLLSLRKLREMCRKNRKFIQKSSLNELLVPKVNTNTLFSAVPSCSKDVQSNKRSALKTLSSNVSRVFSVGIKTQPAKLDARIINEHADKDGTKPIGFISPMGSIMN